MKTLALYMKSGSVIRAVVRDAEWDMRAQTGEILRLKIDPVLDADVIIGPVVLSQIEAIAIEAHTARE